MAWERRIALFAPSLMQFFRAEPLGPSHEALDWSASFWGAQRQSCARLVGPVPGGALTPEFSLRLDLERADLGRRRGPGGAPQVSRGGGAELVGVSPYIALLLAEAPRDDDGSRRRLPDGEEARTHAPRPDRRARGQEVVDAPGGDPRVGADTTHERTHRMLHGLKTAVVLMAALGAIAWGAKQPVDRPGRRSPTSSSSGATTSAPGTSATTIAA